MRLRAIELTDVRRFAGRRARLADIGDGITVLSEPNEFGKSTFFDALHAVFFERHSSRNAAVKALQPHAGGAPQVAVEIELPEGRFRIAKRWLNRPHAQVTDPTGRLIAQADEVEAWIDRLLGGGLAGPSGLLWVRQGTMGLETEGNGADDRRERERGLAARRDLLSSVAGEIDMMTGGRRMDAVLDRVGEAIARLATPTGRPRAGGEWARAVDEADALAAQEEDLRSRALMLANDLSRRAEVQRTLARLSDPEEAAARARSLREAETARQGALAHQAKVVQAETELKLAQLASQKAQSETSAAQALADRLEQAQSAMAKAVEAARAARDRAEELNGKEQTALAEADAAAGRTHELRQRLAAAIRSRSARQASAQAVELKRRLERATDLQAIVDQSRARRDRLRISAKLLDAIENAQAALDLARARAEAQAATIEAKPDGAAQAMVGDRPLPPGPQPVLAAMDLVLPGFGSLRVVPGMARQSEPAAAIATASQDLARRLEEAQLDSVAAARSARADAVRLDEAIRQASALFAEIAPDGLDPLRAALARALAEAAQTSEEAEDVDLLTDAVRQAEAEEQEARAAARTAQNLASAASNTRAATEANRVTAARHFESARSEAGDVANLADRIATLRSSHTNLTAALTEAEAALATLRAAAPDLATAEARFARARGTVEQAERDHARAREELANLNGTIGTYAEEGIEERLSEVTEKRVEAQARAARYEAEFRALSRLRRALEEARSSARDAYFGPVLRELRPLLSILSPGAQLKIDDASLLPASLTRNGQEEALEILSGGTREQVAILTRLAFARLFAASGRPVPVILDDALVHSDDERIEAMFDALHRTAREQQILVLTCRTRAFSILGGMRATVEVTSI